MSESVAQTRRWLEQMVVGLDLCPFARGPLQAGRVRIAVSVATDLEMALADLGVEFERLVGTPTEQLETTLLVFGSMFGDLEDFLDATELARALLTASELDGELQLADFHPDYVFADVPEDDPANATNRSPNPIWHLLRETSVGRAADGHPDVGSIPERNQRLLRGMDPEKLRKLLGLL